MIQAMGGLMSITGDPDGEPMKVGVAAADLFAGQYAVIAILAALGARERTGEGQYIDIALFDSQLGWLANVASNYLISGNLPERYGNAHPNIVPYQSFAAADGWFALAVGNDKQFMRLCELIGQGEWARDERFVSNAARVTHRDELVALLKPVFTLRGVEEWLAALEAAGIPCGPINTLDKVFAEPQVSAREMLVTLEHPTIGDLPLVGSPLKFSQTPVEYRLPPPRLGEHTDEILRELHGQGRKLTTETTEL
jgi:crotonobetainyl-CoA:carnitine CoA-transferase CaiB-like acyl-CoA transferase